MSLVFEIGEWIGTAAFAVSGAMVAIDRGADLFGVLLLAAGAAPGPGMKALLARARRYALSGMDAREAARLAAKEERENG